MVASAHHIFPTLRRQYRSPSMPPESAPKILITGALLGIEHIIARKGKIPVYRISSFIPAFLFQFFNQFWIIFVH
jgi:hypothetical protein